MDWVEYENDAVEVRVLWNCSKHDESNNKYERTSCITVIEMAGMWIRSHGAKDAVKKMLDVLGQGQLTNVKRWIRMAQNLSQEQRVMDQLAQLDSQLPLTFLCDNVFFPW